MWATGFDLVADDALAFRFRLRRAVPSCLLALLWEFVAREPCAVSRTSVQGELQQIVEGAL